MKTKILLITTMLFLLYSCSSIPSVNITYNEAKVFTENGKLIVSTGNVERAYELTPEGLATVSFRDLAQGREWVSPSPSCDWNIENNEVAELVSLKAYEGDDERFTDRHICVEANFDYPESKIHLKYLVWVYPNAKGLRTQLLVKGMAGYVSAAEDFTSGITETISLKEMPLSMEAFGYRQGIKTNDKEELLRDEEVLFNDGEIDWASGLLIKSNDAGLILIKESNKSTSLKPNGDVATGSFIIDGQSIYCTGMGMYPQDISTEKYLKVWANWIILAPEDTYGALLTLKEFDRQRYPVHTDRDVFMMANTWGTEDLRPGCLYAAREENVLKELESVADLGIDILQIDDGWQTKDWLPAKTSAEHEHKDVIGNYPVYPTGWGNVKRRAKELNVKLGLWAAWTAPLDRLKWNYDQGLFNAFKLDFANLNTIQKREELMDKARELIKHSDYNTCVNWDVTEVPPRVGYFYGREYGNVYLENRKVTTVRPNVQYVPYKVLQDAWLLSKYVNLNKFQVTVQNIDMTKDPSKTDAKKYNHPYVVGISLMSSPIFFQETRYYNKKARAEVKEVLSAYRKHREKMFEGYVFPIGSKPNNASWTGFQNYHPEEKSGYLTIFRELHNKEFKKSIPLLFMTGDKIKLTNLLTQEEKIVDVNNHAVIFEMSKPASFEFYKYETLSIN